MIRILNVIGRFSHGGIENQLLRVLQSYDRDRFTMDVCCTMPGKGSLEEHAKETGTNIIRCLRSPNLHSFAYRFRDTVKNRGYDIVHSNFELWSGAILRGAFLAEIPVRIAHLHDIELEGRNISSKFYGRMARRVLGSWGTGLLRKYSTHVLGASRAVLDARWPEWHKEPHRFDIFNAGVDVQRFFPNRQTGRRKRITCVGSFLGSAYPNKRQDFLIKVFAEVRKTIPDVELVLAGSGPHELNCRMLAAQMGLSDAVHFLGRSDNVPDILRDTAVFALCSESEAMPTVLMEAQASGLAIAASDIPAHREVLHEKFHEFLFPLDSRQKAVSSLVSLLTNSSLRRHLGKLGRSHVVEKHNFSVQSAKLESFYQTCIKSVR